MRRRACWMYAEFSDIKFKENQNLMKAVDFMY